MLLFRSLFLFATITLSGCKSASICPESFNEFPRHFHALQQVKLPKLKIPLPIALAKIDRVDSNWDVSLMEPI